MADRIFTMLKVDSPFKGTDVEEARAYYHDVMTKSMICAEELVTIMAEQDKDNEIAIGELMTISFDLNLIRPAFEKAGLSLYEDDGDQLLDGLMRDFIEEQLTTCAIFELAHTIHHHVLNGARRTAN